MLFTKRLACTAAAMHMPASAYARNLFTTPMRHSNVTRLADRSGLWAVDKLRRTSNIIDVMESTMDAMRREMSREIGVPIFDMSDGQWLRRADNVVETSMTVAHGGNVEAVLDGSGELITISGKGKDESGRNWYFERTSTLPFTVPPEAVNVSYDEKTRMLTVSVKPEKAFSPPVDVQLPIHGLPALEGDEDKAKLDSGAAAEETAEHESEEYSHVDVPPKSNHKAESGKKK